MTDIGGPGGGDGQTDSTRAMRSRGPHSGPERRRRRLTRVAASVQPRDLADKAGCTGSIRTEIVDRTAAARVQSAGTRSDNPHVPEPAGLCRWNARAARRNREDGALSHLRPLFGFVAAPLCAALRSRYLAAYPTGSASTLRAGSEDRSPASTESCRPSSSSPYR